MSNEAKKPGRPAKGYITLHCEIPAATGEILACIAAAAGCSKGEAVAIAVQAWRAEAKRRIVTKNNSSDS